MSDDPCVYHPELCVPVDAISDGNAESASDPDIFLWFY